MLHGASAIYCVTQTSGMQSSDSRPKSHGRANSAATPITVQQTAILARLGTALVSLISRADALFGGLLRF